MSISPKTVQMALVRLGVKPHLAAVAAADKRITWTEEAIDRCTAFHNASTRNHPGSELWELLKTGRLPRSAPVLVATVDTTCPASTRDDTHTIDRCRGIHNWPAIHTITGTPCISAPDDPYHSRCIAPLRAPRGQELDHAA